MTNTDIPWFYMINQTKFGPIAEHQVVEQIKNGNLNKNTLMWTFTLEEWMPLSQTRLNCYIQPPTHIMSATNEPASIQYNIPNDASAKPKDPSQELKVPSPLSRASKAFWAAASLGSTATIIGSGSTLHAPVYVTLIFAICSGLLCGLAFFPFALLWCCIFKKN